MSNLSPRVRGMTIALVGVVFWATTGIFISYLLDHYPLRPLTIAFWRDLMIGTLLFIVMSIAQPRVLKISIRDLPFFLVYGFVGLAVFNGMWTYSVQYNGAAVATVLAYCSPALTVLLARPILKEPLTPRKLLAVGLSLLGCVFVAKAYSVEQWSLNPIGIGMGLGTGLAFALYNLAGRWSANRFASPWTVTTYGFLFAALGLALTQRLDSRLMDGLFFANPVFSLGQAWDGWAILGVLVIPSLLGFGLYTLSLRYLQASVAGLIAALEPVLTAVMAIFILNEWLEPVQWLGAGLILTAVVMVQAESPKSEPASLPQEASVV